MRRATSIVLILLVLSGCGASRKTMKSDTETVREAAAAVHAEADTTVTEQTTTHAELSKDEEIITEVTEFDTSRPVDPATGTPPVKRKTKQVRRAATQAQQVTTANTEAVGSSTMSADAAEKENTATHSEEKARRGLNWWQTALCAIGVIAILAGALWLWIHSVTNLWKGRK
ncbi:hypothetical protein SAMN05444145_105235 [Alistipes timonensis JC136]|uniref:Uncharacterized protein n=1 Tax=Alistipes timonensis JC136 TaxID=1033731 RepID=A0A1H4DCL8_9BACT|nr:hypothetical protein [Alistipes timonensis]SEA70505.1 hypothetical protein SAMN05444145_105235 [Alistipes timonensis JC136]